MFSYTKFFAQPPNYNLDKHGVVVLFFNLLKNIIWLFLTEYTCGIGFHIK